MSEMSLRPRAGETAEEVVDRVVAAARMQRVLLAVDEADDAFWAKIVEHFPEVKTGDFGPEETTMWRRAMSNAVCTWLHFNHPDHPTFPGMPWLRS